MNTPDTEWRKISFYTNKLLEVTEAIHAVDALICEYSIFKATPEKKTVEENTPDIKWREVYDKVGYTLNIGGSHTYIENRLTPEEMQGIKELIEHSLTLRDTYWKERAKLCTRGMCPDDCPICFDLYNEDNLK
jgi:hypothetical protein